MMDYAEFKEKLKNEIKNFLPTEYKNAKISINRISKNNRTIEGLSIRKPGMTMSPCIYMEYIYEDYKASGDFKACIKDTVEQYLDNLENVAEKTGVGELKNINFVKEHVVFQLINTAQNTERLAKLPHRDFHDLSIIYRIVMKAEKSGIISTIITNELASEYNISEEMLYSLAYENTRNVFPVKIVNLVDMLNSTVGVETNGNVDDNIGILVATNTFGVNGAYCILYKEVLENIADKLGGDFYILPSSIHEILAVPAGTASSKELAQMVLEVNQTEVLLEERLSNHVYYYNQKTHKIECCNAAIKETLI